MQYIIANFKSNKNKQEIINWINNFNNEAKLTPFDSVQVIVAPPSPYYHLFHNHPLISLAGQDVSPFPSGSYTGSVSAIQLSDNQVEYCIIGHSERRHYFGETHSDIARKAQELISCHITPIICLTENDFQPQFANLEDTIISKSLFAFENPQDIGGQTTTDIDRIQTSIQSLKDYTKNTSLGLLYGGSVNENNADTLSGIVDGLLIATASQDPHQFATTIRRFSPNVKK